MLTIEDVARHWRLRPAAVRARIATQELRAVRMAGKYRTTWADVWSCEAMGQPGNGPVDRYRMPLMTKAELAAAMGVSTRTIERWTRAGLPARSIGSSTRFNRFEVGAWVRQRFGIDVREALGLTGSEIS